VNIRSSIVDRRSSIVWKEMLQRSTMDDRRWTMDDQGTVLALAMAGWIRQAAPRLIVRTARFNAACT
jgi:hypothetical protein